MTLGIRDLRALLAVEEELNFARAARRLNVAQPALSRRILRIEAELGYPLFNRSTRRVAPTAAGRVLADRARGVLAQLDRAVEAAGRAADGKSGEVAVGYNDFAIAGPLPDLVRCFETNSPGPTVRLHRAGTQDQIALLRQGQIDVAFVVGPIRPEGLEARTVWREPFRAVMVDGDPLASLPAVPVETLASRPHVLGDRRGWQLYRERLSRLYVRAPAFPDIVAEGPDTSVILGLVASGVGVTVYPACIENTLRRGLAVRPIAGTDAALETAMVWSPDGSPAALRFVEAATLHCGRWPDGRYDLAASVADRRASA